MPITSIVIIITLLLVTSIAGSFMFNKKQQADLIRRQEIANFRYKADEAQNYYDELQSAGLEKIVYQFLLDRIVANLNAAYRLNPNTPGVRSRLESAKSTIESIESITYAAQMPSGITELHGLIGHLNKLVKYTMLLFQKRIIPDQIYQQLMPSIQRTLIKYDAEGHIKMGHQAANDGQRGTAKQSYLYAKEKLINFGVEDPYVAQQLDSVEELINKLEAESSQLPEDNNLDATQMETSDIKADTPMSQEENDINDAVTSQIELNKKNKLQGDFAPKKKW